MAAISRTIDTALSRTGTEALERTATRRIDRRAAVVEVIAFIVFVGVATAYGFLDGKGNHPSLKLTGALSLASLAPVALLLTRSSIGVDGATTLGTPSGAFPGTERRDILTMVLALLSLAAASIHLAVIEQHFTEYWLYGAFFVAVGLFEAAWAVLVIARPARVVYGLSVVVNALTVAAYVVTRKVGLLVGPAAHETEKVGFGDMVATVFECVLVIGSMLLLVRSWGRVRIRPAASEAWIGAAAVLIVAPTALALLSTVGLSRFVAPAG
jgi:hypothetical protein